MERRDKTNYYLDLAEVVAKRSTCLRRHYVGAPRGRQNCTDMGTCVREQLQIPRGERYELCRSVHAEQNAIISAGRDKMIGATMYLAGYDAKTGDYIPKSNSCSLCKKMIINAGIEKVIVRDNQDEYREVMVQDWIDNDESIEGKRGY